MVFAHVIEAEDHAAAEAASLEECPECGDRMSEANGDKVCHGCGHRQPIITQRMPDHIGSLCGTRVQILEAGSLFGADGVVARVESGFLGWPDKAIVQVGGREYSVDPGDLMVKSAQWQALLPELLGGGGGEMAAGGMGGAAMMGEGGGGLADPGMLGRLMGHAMNGQGQTSQGTQSGVPVDPGAPGALGSPGNSMSVAPTGVVGSAQFGEDSVGLATKNRGDNSTEDAASSGITGMKEQGDSPEQLKGVDGGPGGLSPDEQGQLEKGGMGDLTSTALKAFNGNLPLVLEYAFSDKSGTDHPLLVALDEMLEEAFPGYKDDAFAQFNQDEGDETESPTERMEENIGQDLDNDGDQPGGGRPQEAKLVQARQAAPEAMAMGYGAGTQPTMPPMSPAMMPQGQLEQCAVCGQAHMPGLCPLADNTLPDPTAGGAVTPPQPQTVVTHMAASIDEPDNQEIVPMRQHEERMRHDEEQEHHDNRYEDEANAPPDTGWYEDWEGPEGEEQAGKHSPWEDDKGEPLHEGQEYEMHSTEYAVPDRITVESVAPDRITYLIHGGAVDYRDELTLDDVHNYGYTFRLPTSGNTDSESGFDMETQNPQPPAQPKQHLNLEHPNKQASPVVHDPDGWAPNMTYIVVDEQGNEVYRGPEWRAHQEDRTGVPFKDQAGTNWPPEYVRPPQAAVPPAALDPLPQEDDLSIPDTKQGHRSWTDPVTGEEHEYTGSFRGDTVEARDWLFDSSPVDVDPTLMAKFAGRDYSPREQREFIDEPGTARNLPKLQLDGTHYLSPDPDTLDTLW